MPGFLLHVGATVQCTHAGRATPSAPFPRVMVSGQHVVTLPTQYLVAGCPFPTTSGGPCVSAQWTTAATRVLAGGQPVLLMDSQATCMPTGVPLQVLTTQTRVQGT
jgi:hypothetical protein